MAVIQDEQGNNKPIKTDTSHVFDVNGNPLHGELFIGETIASDDVEEIDGYAHESEVAEINSNLAALPKIQRGTASGNTGLISVTFDTTFSSTPTVVVSAYGTDSNANNRVAVVRSVSSVGFQAKVSVANTGGDASTAIMWIAVGE